MPMSDGDKFTFRCGCQAHEDADRDHVQGCPIIFSKRLLVRDAVKLDLLKTARHIIANAGGWKDRETASEGWQESAILWREQYQKLLREIPESKPSVDEVAIKRLRDAD